MGHPWVCVLSFLQAGSRCVAFLECQADMGQPWSSRQWKNSSETLSASSHIHEGPNFSPKQQLKDQTVMFTVGRDRSFGCWQGDKFPNPYQWSESPGNFKVPRNVRGFCCSHSPPVPYAVICASVSTVVNILGPQIRPESQEIPTW